MATLEHRTNTLNPAADRVALIAELHTIRAWEHSYGCFDDADVRDRARDIMALLAPVVTA